MAVQLREITKDTVISIVKLDAGDDRTQVAPNAVSIAQAYFQKEAWFRAILAGDELVGFVMLNDPTLVERPDEPAYRTLEARLVSELDRAVTAAFSRPFLLAALFAVAALVPIVFSRREVSL